MKVLMINGSPHLNGNTSIALKELEKAFSALGVETEIVNLGKQAYGLPQSEELTLTNFIR